MTTGRQKLTRQHLRTFDTFATDAVLTAMKLGGTGRIQSNGHAKIYGKNGVQIIISRDTSAPHCQGNVLSALERAFPELKTNKTNGTKKDTTVSTSKPKVTVQSMVECPAKGCDEKFANLGEANAHVHAEHYICKWEGCDMGPDGGPFVGRTKTSVAGHTNIRHKGNRPWEQNREKAAVNRAATFAAKKAARRKLAAGIVDEHGHPALVAPTMPEQVAVPVENDPTAFSNSDLNGDRHPGHPEDPDALAKLELIKEILGVDPEVARLRKELADLKAHLALVREAVGLDFDDATD